MSPTMPTYQVPSATGTPSSPSWSSEFNRHFQMVLTRYSPNQEDSIDKAYEEAKSHPAFAPHFAKGAYAAGKEASTKAKSCDTPIVLKPRSSLPRATLGIDPTLLDDNADSDAMTVDHSLDYLEELPRLSQIPSSPPLAASVVDLNPYMALTHPHALQQFSGPTSTPSQVVSGVSSPFNDQTPFANNVAGYSAHFSHASADFGWPHNDGHAHAGPSQAYATQAEPSGWVAPQTGSPVFSPSGSEKSSLEGMGVDIQPSLRHGTSVDLKLPMDFVRLMEDFSGHGEAFAYIQYALEAYFRNLSAATLVAASISFPCSWNPPVNGQPCTAILTTETMMAHLKTHHGVKSKARVCNWDKCRNQQIDGELKRHLPRHNPSGIVPRRAVIQGTKFGNKTFGAFEYMPDPVGRSDMAPRAVGTQIRKQIADVCGLKVPKPPSNRPTSNKGTKTQAKRGGRRGRKRA
ncbi:hypothetical protein BKA70DRAFT_682874 [Coprinopsis sp. MPI-PUGE-AT-0042]|nr:hypothetical protein BKA70DRAFT_682874 [Coprinopsis sp. MPI-PUGE-AT-0042]